MTVLHLKNVIQHLLETNKQDFVYFEVGQKYLINILAAFHSA